MRSLIRLSDRQLTGAIIGLCFGVYVTAAVARAALSPPAGWTAASIQAALRDDLACDLPRGTVYLDERITTPWSEGCRLSGAGAVSPKSHPRAKWRGTKLVYRGPTDQPAITIRGRHAKLAGFTLVLPNGGVGVEFAGSKQGIGVGRMAFDDVLIEGATIGIRSGATPWDANCDTGSFNELEFLRCETCWLNQGHMSMGHHFHSLRARECQTVFDIRGGGDLHVFGAFVDGGTFFRLSEGNPKQARPGRNNASFSVTGLKVDAKHRGGFVLLDSELPTAWVTARDIHVSGPKPYTLARMPRANRLTIDGLVSPAPATIQAPREAVELRGVRAAIQWGNTTAGDGVEGMGR